MGKVNCQTVNIEGMRVPVGHVMIELRLPVDGMHAGEVGDPGFRVTSSDACGLPRAENMEDWDNTEASLKARLGSSVYDALSAFEKEVLLRGTPLGHGRYTFLLKVESSGKIRGPEVTVADLKKLGKFSPRAHVYADPVSGARVFTTYLADGEQFDYRSVLGAPVAFDAKKARGAAGRLGKRPGKVWDAARGNPAVLEMLLDGISPGSSDKMARIKGTRRANAQQMAWILQSPGAADCVHEVLSHTHEVLEEWTTDDDVARWNKEIENGADSRHFEQYFEHHHHVQDRVLDTGLRLIRGLADLLEDDPDFLRGERLTRHTEMREALQKTLAYASRDRRSAEGREVRRLRELAPENTHRNASDLIALAAALGYVSAQQAVSIRDAAATFAPSSIPTTPNSDVAAAVNPSTTEEVLVELAQASSGEPSVEGKTEFVARVRKEAGMETAYNPWWGLPEHVTGPFPVTGPDGVTRLEMLPLPDAFTRESAGPRRLMRIDVRRSKFASNGHYDGDTVRFELLEGRVLLSCPWEDYDLLVKKAGPDADVDAFIREILGKVKAGHATLVDADTKDDLDPGETLTQMVLAIRVGSMNVEDVLVNDAIKRHLGVDPIALGNEMAEYLRKNPRRMDPDEIAKIWENAADEDRTRKVVTAPRVPGNFLNKQLPVLRSLGLPVGRAAVSGSLVFVGIPGIEPKDIDILCDQETWHAYSRDPRAVWRTTKTGAKAFAIDGAEFFTDLPGILSPAAPAVDAALATSEVRWGVPFLSVACMRDWKQRAGREKDLGHVRLVDEFLQQGGIVPGRRMDPEEKD